MRKRKGFTLIELVMVIVILGLLAAVAIPKFTDLSERAETAAEAGVVGGVRSGIATYYAAAEPPGWPSKLDPVVGNDANPVAASKDNPFFVNVLAQGGITDDWTKKANEVYVGPTGREYTYTAADGTFTLQQ